MEPALDRESIVDLIRGQWRSQSSRIWGGGGGIDIFGLKNLRCAKSSSMNSSHIRVFSSIVLKPTPPPPPRPPHPKISQQIPQPVPARIGPVAAPKSGALEIVDRTGQDRAEQDRTRQDRTEAVKRLMKELPLVPNCDRFPKFPSFWITQKTLCFIRGSGHNVAAQLGSERLFGHLSSPPPNGG